MNKVLVNQRESLNGCCFIRWLLIFCCMNLFEFDFQQIIKNHRNAEVSSF